ncbi:MAG: hypothetical protein ACI38U_05345 [Corynebacterium sp.]|jgi:hypothetical protein|uniref:hypothetical protein n=1 Tax=unclassified Corynebacterium TaxID=2624378 RepID=UPI001115380F|nr:hypothetical protein [Corynebacterium sp. CNJ-954]
MKPESEATAATENTEAPATPENMEAVEEPEQPEIPGSSTADVVTLLFMAAMIIATVVCFIFLM